MKKSIITAYFFYSCIFMFGQSNHTQAVYKEFEESSKDANSLWYYEGDVERSDVLKNKIMMFRKYALLIHEGIVQDSSKLEATEEFTENGNTRIRRTFNTSNGRVVGAETSEYNPQNNVLKFKKVTINSIGDITMGIQYDKNFNILERYYYLPKQNAPFSSYIAKYDSNKIYEAVLSNKSDDRIYRKWVYLYDKEGDLLKTTLSGDRNITICVWNHDCRNSAATVTNNEVINNSCKRQTTDSVGNRIVIVTRFDKGVQIGRELQKYNSKDQQIANLVWNEKNVLVSGYDATYTISPIDSSVSKQTLNYKDGKIDFVQKLIKLKDRRIILDETYNSDDRLIQRNTYFYNSNKTMIRQVRQYFSYDGAKMVKDMTTIYRLNDKGLLIGRITLDPYDKPMNGWRAEYDYYR